MFLALWLLACASPVCDVVVSDVHTVLRAQIDTPRPERLSVVWEAEGQEHHSPLDDEEQRTHEVLLFDLAPLVDVAWRVLDGADDEVCAGEATTANLAPGTPPFTSVTPGEPVDGYWLVPMFGVSQGKKRSRVGLFRADGTWIWQLESDLDRQIVSADLTADGVRYNQFDFDRLIDVASLETVGLDGERLASEPTSLAHHFYVPLDDGAVAYLQADARITERFGCVVGDTLLERAADGTERKIWSAWDTFPVQVGQVWDNGFYPLCKDWTHGSGLSWRASDDTLLLTLLGPRQVVHIDRDTGRTLATFGTNWQIPTAPDSPAFAVPHNATWAADGRLLIFDSHDDLPESGCYAYRVDPETRSLMLEDRWADRLHKGTFLGGVQELPDGRISCSWGADGFVRVFPAESSVQDYELRVDGLLQFGSATWIPDLSVLSSGRSARGEAP